MKGARLAIAVTVVIITLFSGTKLLASSPVWCDSLRHSLSVELRPAYNIVSHYAMSSEGRPLNNALSVHARYTFEFSPNSKLGQLFPSSYQGVGVAAYTFWSHKQTGTPMVAYIMQGAPIAELGRDLSIGYEWNLGFSWGWYPNDAMNSRYNVMINVALPLSWRVAPHWEFRLTPDYTHFSNGDTSFSNSGANLFGVRVGVAYMFDAERVDVDCRRFIQLSQEFSTSDLSDRISYDVMLYGGWRADRFQQGNRFYVIDDKLPTFGVSFQPHYHLNRYFALGASLDVHLDSSLNLYTASTDESSNVVDYERPSLWRQMKCGLSVRAEIQAPIFTIGVGVGYNMLRTGYDYSPLYTTFSLKAFVSKRAFLCVCYYFNSMQYTHNLMYGLGMRF